MDVQVERKGGLRYCIRGEVDSQTFQRERKRLLQKLAANVALKGFRPGHAPPELVALHLGKDVEEETRKNIVEHSLEEALRTHGLRPAYSPDIEVNPTAANGAFSFTAEFEIFPQVQPKDYLGLEIPEITLSPVTEEDVEKGLNALRQMAAIAEPRGPDEPAHEGDLAVCTIVAQDAENGTFTEEPRDFMLEVGLADRPYEDIGRELLGMRIGQEKVITREVCRQDGSRQRLTVKIKMLKLMQKRLPELNDEFAKTFGGFTSLAEWRERIRAELEKKRQENIREMVEEAVINALIEANPLELGEETVRRFMQEVKKDVEARVLQGKPEATKQKVIEELDSPAMREAAKRKLAATVLLDAIADQEGIRPTTEEVYEKLRSLGHEDALRQRSLADLSAETINELRARIRREKTLDMLVRYAVVKPRIEQSKIEPAGQGLIVPAAPETGLTEPAPTEKGTANLAEQESTEERIVGTKEP